MRGGWRGRTRQRGCGGRCRASWATDRERGLGMRRSMSSKLDTVPGTKFVYSDINFITLGAIVEKVSGQTLDEYAERHIFGPLKMMHTRYLPVDKACGADEAISYPIVNGRVAFHD